MAKIKALELFVYLNSREAFGLDESVVHVNNKHAKNGKSHSVNVEYHREVRLRNLNEHVGALDSLPGLGFLHFAIFVLLLHHSLTVKHRHLHDVEAALGIIHILLKLHHTLLHAECNDNLSLRRNNEVLNRDNTCLVSFVESHVVLLHPILVPPNELCNVGCITEKADPYCQLV